jgi:hypothetical protein
MIIERQLEFLILKNILEDYDKGLIDRKSLDKNYDTSKMEYRYIELEREFLNDYALNKTEKSD